MGTQARQLFRFGPFEVDPDERRLTREGIPVPLTPKAFDILLVLIQSAGHTVEKDKLLKEVWPETFVEEGNLAVNIFAIRKALGTEDGGREYIETIPKRGYRFVGSVHEQNQVSVGAKSELTTSRENVNPRRLWSLALTMSVVVAAGLVAGAFYRRSEAAKALTERDTVVLADFVNSTGDAVFDETLKQALSVELTQSPFMNVASDVQVAETLRRMGKPSNQISKDTAAEACLRMGGKAVLVGSISQLGNRYVLGLEALGCARGNTLAVTQSQAASKGEVLKAVNAAASEVRRKVGESLSSLEKFDFPVDTTTKSLAALKAFSMGQKALRDSGEGDAIPFLQEAIQIDPDFALAYTVLGRAYENVGEDAAAITNFTKAFQLRAHLSEREKYHIETLYYETVVGDLERARAAAESWVQTYPRDGYAREKLATVHADLGELEQAYTQAQEALRLDPESAVNVFNAVLGAESLNRIEEAEHILKTAQERGLDGPIIHQCLYSLAFLRGDSPEMERQITWTAGKPHADDLLLSQHSDTAAYYGKIREARELSRRAAESARRDQAKEIAAIYEMLAGLREIEIGYAGLGKRALRNTAQSHTRELTILSAVAAGRIGDGPRALSALSRLASQNSANTLLQYYWLPVVKAAIEIHANHPQAALALLEPVRPYEWSVSSNLWAGYPVYLRGQAYLLAGQASDAAAEFRRLLEKRGLLQSSILIPLSRLELARAEVLMRDIKEARKTYGDFLSLWKDADSDIPILKEAKAELAKL